MNSLITPVIFRFWKPRAGLIDGASVIALLPDMPASIGSMLMYEHVGQHGEGDYAQVMKDSRPATPSEYAALCDELQDIYGSLIIVKRDSARYRSLRYGVKP